MEKETQQTINAPMHHVDYKDITRLKSNVNPHARIMSRRRTGMSAKGQRNFARAIKRARFMALMPYTQH
jgi:small subunit ribosomal protein S18